MKPFMLSLAAIAIAATLAGCSSGQKSSDWDAQHRERQEHSRQMAAGAGASCSSGCNQQHRCGRCTPQQPPAPPTVIREPCDTSSPLITPTMTLGGTARLTVDQITNARLEFVGPDGQVCTVDQDSQTATTVTEIPIEATVRTGGTATVGVRPNP